MKLIKLSIALLFSAVMLTGCEGFSDLFKNGINVNLDKTATISPSNGLVRLSGSESLLQDSDGNLYLKASDEKKFDVNAGSQPVSVDGVLYIKPECDMYPKTVDEPKLCVTLDNLSDKAVAVEDAVIKVDGKEEDKVTIEANAKSTGKIIMERDDMSAGLGSALSSKPDEVSLSDLTIATKADSNTLGFWMEIPFKYKKGEVISIDRSFAELGLSGVEIGYLGKTFKIEMEVTSTFPFVITSQAESVEKVKANLDTPLAAGSPDNPVVTKAVITVESEETIDVVSDAIIHLQLTAEEGARLTKDTKLVIHYKTLNIK